MAEPIPISLGKGSNKGRYGQEGLAEFVNCYVEQLGEEGKVQWPVHAINGTTEFATLPLGGAVRAMMPLDDRVLALSGRILFTMATSGDNPTAVGGIPSDGFVTMARNRQSPNPQVVIVCDGAYFIYQSGTLTPGADSDLPPPICVVETNGYFVFLIEDGRWFISGIDNTDIDGLDFSSALFSPDKNVMAGVRGRELVIFGQRSMQFYVDNAASEDFPFSLVQTASIGCYAAGSVSKIVLQPGGGSASDTLIWAATDHKGAYCGVMVMSGYSGSKISTPELDRYILAETDPTAIRSFAWTEDGHSFYCITGTNFSMTWDGATGKWHKRKSDGLNRWRMSCHAQVGQSHIFGDYDDNVLYVSDGSVYTENGAPIVAQVVTPPVSMFPNPFVVNTLYLDVLTGVGVNSTTDADANPQIIIDYTDDGGATFGGERMVNVGADAQRYVSLDERALGRFGVNGVSFRFTFSAACAKALLQAAVDVTKLKA